VLLFLSNDFLFWSQVKKLLLRPQQHRLQDQQPWYWKEDTLFDAVCTGCEPLCSTAREIKETTMAGMHLFADAAIVTALLSYCKGHDTIIFV